MPKRPLGPRRPLRLLLMALVMGALTSTLVAWFFAATRFHFRPASNPSDSTHIDFGADQVSISRYRHLACNVMSWQPRSAQRHYFLPRNEHNESPPRIYGSELSLPWNPQPLPEWVPAWARYDTLQQTDRRVDDVWTLAAGWPLLSHSCTFLNTRLHGKPWRYDYTTVHGIPLHFVTKKHPRSTTYHHAGLPLAPIWPGFALNSLLYAIPWAALLLIPSARRIRRARRTRCPWCAYHLGNDFHRGCPECGWNRADPLTPAPTTPPPPADPP